MDFSFSLCNRKVMLRFDACRVLVCTVLMSILYELILLVLLSDKKRGSSDRTQQMQLNIAIQLIFSVPADLTSIFLVWLHRSWNQSYQSVGWILNTCMLFVRACFSVFCIHTYALLESEHPSKIHFLIILCCVHVCIGCLYTAQCSTECRSQTQLLVHMTLEKREFDRAVQNRANEITFAYVERRRMVVVDDCVICLQPQCANDELLVQCSGCANKSHSACMQKWMAVKRVRCREQIRAGIHLHPDSTTRCMSCPSCRGIVDPTTIHEFRSGGMLI